MGTYMDHAPCLFLVSSDDRTVVEVNEHLCSTLGYSMAELVESKLDQLFPVATRIFYQTHLFPLLKMRGKADEIFVSFKTRTGEEVPVLLNTERKEVDGKNVTIHIGIVVYNRRKFEDELIAARRTAENALQENTLLVEARRELRKHTEQLESQMTLISQHNEQLAQFSRIVTHDMQEPLRKLTFFSNLLLEEGELAQQKNIVTKIQRVTGQMRNVISGLQKYIWLSDSTVKVGPVDLDKLLLVVRRRLEEAHPAVRLTLAIQDLHRFYGDWEQMQLLFTELLSNAIRFRKHEQEAVISVTTTTLQLNRFRHMEGEYSYAEYLRIVVSDEGKGFKNEFKHQAFELFKRLHGESGGGVGLALCKKIADNHGGEIFIDSQEGKGTTVTIELPMQPEEGGHGYARGTTPIDQQKSNTHERE
jgi:sigma-B regulation protein RsbU (phosphoserine phosphatase)